jgi:hypothetical protein
MRVFAVELKRRFVIVAIITGTIIWGVITVVPDTGKTRNGAGGARRMFLTCFCQSDRTTHPGQGSDSIRRNSLARSLRQEVDNRFQRVFPQPVIAQPDADPVKLRKQIRF